MKTKKIVKLVQRGLADTMPVPRKRPRPASKRSPIDICWPQNKRERSTMWQPTCWPSNDKVPHAQSLLHR